MGGLDRFVADGTLPTGSELIHQLCTGHTVLSILCQHIISFVCPPSLAQTTQRPMF
jgi:hypothetical protein